MAEIAIGTCSWTDPALVRSGWYPPGRRDAEGRLRHYAGRFPVVEVDAAYYGLPQLRNSERWAERTPPGFRFDVKAFSLLTGHPTPAGALPPDLRPLYARVRGQGGGRESALTAPGPRQELLDEVWRRFAAALRPLRETGRIGSVLLQFPPWFVPGPQARAALEGTRKRTADWPVSVEFRHPGWWAADQRSGTEALLRDLDAAAVAVDTAQGLPTSLPPVAPVTARHAVVRFHGRSPAWGSGGKEDAYRHVYTRAELAEWLPRLRALAERAERVHVLFNNCCADASVRAAETMRQLLDGEEAGTEAGEKTGEEAGETAAEAAGPAADR
ncbi:DUF72 domain-containing protein [Streptomyces sp. ODS05-4]|uniref:DUF72 domain-containing protein n=1 Tax=Streptomyces sp. ODS05-4 TaxID=2944939 RepID=UPI00210DA8C5|nr:DUF72 domain-containing protein [Streptomyces sp. ODS05-4]